MKFLFIGSMIIAALMIAVVQKKTPSESEKAMKIAEMEKSGEMGRSIAKTAKYYKALGNGELTVESGEELLREAR